MTDPKPKNDSKQEKNPRAKYLNQTQLLQGVAAVNEPLLSPSEHRCLFTLASFTVRPLSEVYAHPGNAILMQACAIATRQGMNAVTKRLLKKKLIEPMGHEKGGRGMATEWRICVEDERFPWPKSKAKPATVELQDNEPETRNARVAGNGENKPATENRKTRNCVPLNPQLASAKPATVELHPNSSTTDSNTTNSKAADKSAPVVMSCSGYQTANSTTGASALNPNSKPESKPTATTAAINANEEWMNQAETQNISREEWMNFHEHARVRGWTPKQRKTFLRETYGVDNVKKLSALQYHAALALLHRCTWKVWYQQMVSAKIERVN
jgi:hypothetical protein